MTFPKYEAYKESGVEWLGEMPEHWIRVPIKHLAVLNPKKSDYQGDQSQLCSFVPMEKLKTGTLILDEERTISDVYAGYTYFENGDVLQAKVTPCFENKNIAIAENLTNGVGFGSSEINVLRAFNAISNRFLYYRLQENNFMDFCIASMTGVAGLQRVPSEVINNFSIALPEKSEQTQIARFLDHETAHIDALIAEQERLIELLKEKRQAVISHAVTKGLDPTVPMKDSGIEWLGEVPEHWGVIKANFLFEEQCRPVRECDEIVTVFRDGQVCLRSRRRESGFTLADLEHGYQGIRKGDLVVHSMDAFAGAIGVSEDDGKSTPEYVVLKPYDQGINCEYFAHVLRVMAQRNFIFVLCQAVRERAPRFRYSKFSLALLPVPPNDEQDEIQRYISNALNRMQVLADEAEKQVALLQERRSALISAAVTGKIDVRGWKAPESDTPTATLEAAYG
ncbi:restriction endonuclease subunit S [Leptolyngbya sp. GB1-A1]|uniref:restriction endonuclease subunit S n=1 Tax=Leptolyngbya sp. GB1-A1 TaxID=2933908 RepID=UPI003297728E